MTDPAHALLFQPFPIGRNGLVMPNRIWLPAMVTWRGTDDGFVTPSVREIYLRYALGGAGMIVLEAIGVRDVASGPLLRLSDDRFVPGLRAARGDAERLRLARDPAGHRLPEDRAPQAHTGVPRGDGPPGPTPERVLGLSDAAFEAQHEACLESARERRDFLNGYRQTIEDLSREEIRSIPGGSPPPRAARGRPASTASISSRSPAAESSTTPCSRGSASRPYPYTGHSGHKCIPRDKRDPFGVNIPLAAGIRGAVRAAGFQVPVVTTGKIARFEQAEAVLREGKADLVGMARALLADPDLPRKWAAGVEEMVRLCVFCPFCEEEDHGHRVVTCTLWPKGPNGPRSRLTLSVWHPGRPWDPAGVFVP